MKKVVSILLIVSIFLVACGSSETVVEIVGIKEVDEDVIKCVEQVEEVHGFVDETIVSTYEVLVEMKRIYEVDFADLNGAILELYMRELHGESDWQTVLSQIGSINDNITVSVVLIQAPDECEDLMGYLYEDWLLLTKLVDLLHQETIFYEQDELEKLYSEYLVNKELIEKEISCFK